MVLTIFRFSNCELCIVHFGNSSPSEFTEKGEALDGEQHLCRSLSRPYIQTHHYRNFNFLAQGNFCGDVLEAKDRGAPFDAMSKEEVSFHTLQWRATLAGL